MVLCALSLEEQALVRQWKEYKKVFLDPLNPAEQQLPFAILKELNTAIADRSYFVGHRFTAVDEEIFTALYHTYAALPFQVKEKLMHLSRWFNTVQHQLLANGGSTQRKLIPFTRTLLYSNNAH